MKKLIIILLSALTIGTVSFAQTKISNAAALEKQIIALDKSAWEAWKNKNVAWFQAHTTRDFLSVTAEGISEKADVIKDLPTGCDVKSFSLADFRFVILNKKTVVLTYIATQDGICGGKKLPSKIRASVTYVKQAGKWLEAFYIDTPIIE